MAADEEAGELATAAGDDPVRLAALVARRVTGEPLAWITGTTTFCGLPVLVHPGVYVPRWQSEHLALAADKRAERWRRIVHEAAQQSRRSDVPILHDPAPLAVRVRAASSATRIVLAEHMDDVLREALALSNPDSIFGPRREIMEYVDGELVVRPGVSASASRGPEGAPEPAAGHA